jgi:hypothetical protein
VATACVEAKGHLSPYSFTALNKKRMRQKKGDRHQAQIRGEIAAQDSRAMNGEERL